MPIASRPERAINQRSYDANGAAPQAIQEQEADTKSSPDTLRALASRTLLDAAGTMGPASKQPP